MKIGQIRQKHRSKFDFFAANMDQNVTISTKHGLNSTITWIQVQLFRRNYASKYEDFCDDMEINFSSQVIDEIMSQGFVGEKRRNMDKQHRITSNMVTFRRTRQVGQLVCLVSVALFWPLSQLCSLYLNSAGHWGSKSFKVPEESRLYFLKWFEFVLFSNFTTFYNWLKLNVQRSLFPVI